MLVLGHQLPVAPRFDLSSEPVRICRFSLCSSQLRAQRIALTYRFGVHLYQLENLFPGLT
ncbi:hypothetical protein D3C86_2040910 [compost metagenome]